MRQKHNLGGQVDIIVVDTRMKAIVCEALSFRVATTNHAAMDHQELLTFIGVENMVRIENYDKRFLTDLVLEANGEDV